jgi:ribosome recycling factor
MVEDIQKDAERRMGKSVQTLEGGFRRLRTGRAHTGLLEHILVEYYGSEVPISQVATLTAEDARTLTVTPWEKEMMPIVEKVILTSDLGLTPVSAGTVIRVPIPAMTEERRKDLVRVVRNEAEASRVAVRNVRRDVLGDTKELLNNKLITKDDDHRVRDEIQKITNRYIDNINNLLKDKEAEIMEV